MHSVCATETYQEFVKHDAIVGNPSRDDLRRLFIELSLALPDSERAVLAPNGYGLAQVCGSVELYNEGKGAQGTKPSFDRFSSPCRSEKGSCGKVGLKL